MKPDETDAGAAWAKRLLRSQMSLRGLSYRHLEVRLREIGIVESEVNLRNKINRGMFSAFFFLQCLNAMEVSNYDVPSWQEFKKYFDDEISPLRPRYLKVPGGYLHYPVGRPESEAVFVKERPVKRTKEEYADQPQADDDPDQT